MIQFIKSSCQYSLFIILLLGFTIQGCGQQKVTYDFPGGYRVKAYWEAIGFMDAGTVFEVYHREEGFFRFEKRVGYAVNWSVDYLSTPPKPEVVLLEGAIVVNYKFGSDTLKIQPNKYPNQ